MTHCFLQDNPCAATGHNLYSSWKDGYPAPHFKGQKSKDVTQQSLPNMPPRLHNFSTWQWTTVHLKYSKRQILNWQRANSRHPGQVWNLPEQPPTELTHSTPPIQHSLFFPNLILPPPVVTPSTPSPQITPSPPPPSPPYSPSLIKSPKEQNHRPFPINFHPYCSSPSLLSSLQHQSPPAIPSQLTSGELPPS